MAGEYDSAIALAQRLITKKGRAIRIVVKSETDETPGKPWLGKTDAPEQTVNTVGAFFQVQLMEALIRLGSGRETPVRSSLTEEEELVLIPAGDIPFQLKPKMLIEDGGNRKEILRLETLAPGLQRVLYSCVVAR